MTNIKVFASLITEIGNNGTILWEITWQRKGEQMFSEMIKVPLNGWKDHVLNKFLPEDVTQALIKKYAFDGKKWKE